MTPFHTELSKHIIWNYLEVKKPKTDLEKTKLVFQWILEYGEKCREIILSGEHDLDQIEQLLYKKTSWKQRILGILKRDER